MEGFYAAEVWLGQCRRFHAVHDQRNEHSVIYPQFPLQREAGVSPEVMQRVEVFSGFSETLRHVLPRRAVSGEENAKVLRVRHFLHLVPVHVVDAVL